MLRDEVVKYYYPGNGYNYSCSESMIRAINDFYDLKLPQEVLYAASCFSGGCWHDELCGGIASALSALGILYSVNGHAHDSDVMRKAAAELFRRVDEEFGTTHCVYLKRHNYVPGIKCEPLLVRIADFTEDIIRNNNIINK
ncbi:MAG: C-GCAxxG-C-C family protein [Erysipelotrichaceae bacterium]|nr:C-GCAxxG-C-C family protein [Erysipelotrichaceae bacterium]